MRRMISFMCGAYQLVGTLDEGTSDVGLLIVSGGNEIRSGAFGGQSALAAHMANAGFSTFRYDRRGIGESEGQNEGFEASAEDIAAALAAFRQSAPQVKRVVAFGNCDAATALGLFHRGTPIDGLILANPWIIESTPTDTERTRSTQRNRHPRTLLGAAQKSAELAGPAVRQDRSAKTCKWFGIRSPKRANVGLIGPLGGITRANICSNPTAHRPPRYDGYGIHGGMAQPGLRRDARFSAYTSRSVRHRLPWLCR